MTEIQRQQENTTSPFQERITLDNYFAGANFEEILREIKTAVIGGVPIMLLTGLEGCGKTMLCHLLNSQQGAAYQAVYFPRTVDSFEDVVRTVALHLNLMIDESGTGVSVEELLENITAHLLGEQQPLLILFDDAENIYLATLERIRKMLDRISEAGGQLHILFSGRNTFLENFQQLTICDFNELEELRFSIEPLTELETTEYLLNTSEKTAHGTEGIFTKEVIRNIYDVAKGNFRMTNILAEEALQNHGDDNSFMVLLESVREEVENEFDEKTTFSIAALLEEYRPYLPWGGGLVVVIALLTLFFSADEQPPEVAKHKVEMEILTPEIREKKKLSAEIEEVLPAPSQSEPAFVVDVEGPVSTPSQEELAANEDESREQMTAAGVIEKKVEKVGSEKIIVVQPFEVVEEETAGGGVEVAAPVKPYTPEPSGESAERETEKVPVIAISPVGKKLKKIPPQEPVLQQDIVELRPVKSMKRKPGERWRDFTLTTPPDNDKKTEKSVSADLVDSSDQLYRNRVIAGNSWKNGSKDRLFTVQLMVLTSKTAEKNLRDMLAEDRYRQEAGNFYIFKKNTDPENVMVFYGEYKTIARARLAQNSLPQFLRDHKPYAISIKGAMAKVNK